MSVRTQLFVIPLRHGGPYLHALSSPPPSHLIENEQLNKDNSKTQQLKQQILKYFKKKEEDFGRVVNRVNALSTSDIHKQTTFSGRCTVRLGLFCKKTFQVIGDDEVCFLSFF
jgi:hypothetical protein